MNGPEHYAEAERIITHSAKTGATCDIAIAQVHATLALAAAAATGAVQNWLGDEDRSGRAWTQVI